MGTPEERLSILEAQMRELIGNGQPGRFQRLETQFFRIEMRLYRNSTMIYIGSGVLIALQFLGANGLLTFIRK
jgi:hypothetical protein